MQLLFAAVMLLVIAGLMVLGFYRVPGVQENGGIAPGFQTSAFLELLSFGITALLITPLIAWFVDGQLKRKWEPARQTARKRLTAALTDVVEDYRTFVVTTITPISDMPRITAGQAMAVLVQRLDRFLTIYDEEHPVFDPAMHSAGSPVRRTLAELRDTMRVTLQIAKPDRSVRVTIGRGDLDKLGALFGKEPGAIGADLDSFYLSPQLLTFGTSHVLPVFEPLNLAAMHDHWQQFLAGASHSPPSPFNQRTLQTAEAQEAAYRAWLALFAENNDVIQHMIKPIGGVEEPAIGPN